MVQNMFTFRGRGSELARLEEIYERERFRTCAVYGRRRIGKTTLLERFCENRRNVYVQFVKGTERDNLKSCSTALSILSPGAEIDSFAKFLEVLKGICSEEKTVIVFDEYPYLSQLGEVYSSELQHFADWLMKRSDSMLIICGSSASMILSEIAEVNRPLYGRFYHRMELKPMTLSETAEFHPGMSTEALLRLYLTIGGVPSYHEMTSLPTYRENVEERMLCGVAMENEVFSYLGELGDVGRFSPVLLALSDGVCTVRAMSDRLGVPESTLRDHVSKLEGLGIVSKVDGMAEGRAPAYVISDYLTSFYYDVFVRNSSVFSSRRGVERYGTVESAIDTHLGRVFEQYCRDFVACCYPCTYTGTWRGTVLVRDEDGAVERDESGKPVTEVADIDVVAVLRNGVNRIDVFGECKFRRRPMGVSDLEMLRTRVATACPKGNIRLVLFSLGGFTGDLTDVTDGESVVLFDLESLTGGHDPPDIH